MNGQYSIQEVKALLSVARPHRVYNAQSIGYHFNADVDVEVEVEVEVERGWLPGIDTNVDMAVQQHSTSLESLKCRSRTLNTAETIPVDLMRSQTGTTTTNRIIDDS